MHNIKKGIITVMVMFTAANSTIPVYAADKLHFTPVSSKNYGTIYKVEGVKAATAGDAITLGVALIDHYYPEFVYCGELTTLARTTSSSPGVYEFAISENGYMYLNAVSDFCDSWCKENLKVIIPEGISVGKALEKVADYIASNMVYDETALDDATLSKYQNAYPGFTEGKGVCATYATMFNTIVSNLPYNTKTGTIDYSSQDTAYLKTRIVTTSSHAWSAIKIGDTWYHYDITQYDATGSKAYLNMSQALLNDELHTGLDTTLWNLEEKLDAAER